MLSVILRELAFRFLFLIPKLSVLFNHKFIKPRLSSPAQVLTIPFIAFLMLIFILITQVLVRLAISISIKVPFEPILFVIKVPFEPILFVTRVPFTIAILFAIATPFVIVNSFKSRFPFALEFAFILTKL
jgi:hypothetical protein